NLPNSPEHWASTAQTRHPGEDWLTSRLLARGSARSGRASTTPNRKRSSHFFHWPCGLSCGSLHLPARKTARGARLNPGPRHIPGTEARFALTGEPPWQLSHSSTTARAVTTTKKCRSNSPATKSPAPVRRDHSGEGDGNDQRGAGGGGVCRSCGDWFRAAL